MEQDRTERAWQLVHAHLDGDRHAFVALVEEHTPLIRYLCRGRPNPQDVIDETWFQALRRIEDGEIPWRRRFSSWLGGLCLNVQRSRALRPESPGQDLGTSASPGREPSDALAAAELHVAIAACLAAADPRLRRIYELHYRDALPLVQVADALDCSEANVRQKLVPKLHDAMRLCLARKGFRDWSSIPEGAGTNPHG